MISQQIRRKFKKGHHVNHPRSLHFLHINGCRLFWGDTRLLERERETERERERERARERDREEEKA